MKRQSVSRIPGSRVMVGLGLVIAGLLSWVAYRFIAPYHADGPALFEVQTDSDRVLRVREDPRGHMHLSLESADGDRDWSLALFRIPSPQGISTGPELITVRLIDFEGHLETHAFETQTGELRWRGGRGEEPPAEGAEAVLLPTLVAGGFQYEFDGAALELLCLGREDGSTRWREPLRLAARGEEIRAVLRGEQVCVSAADGSGAWCRGPNDATRVPQHDRVAGE